MAFETQRRMINDMIIRANVHAIAQGKRIERIELHPTRWIYFVVDMKERFPEQCQDQFEEVEFKHYKVCKGSKLMTEPMVIHYQKTIIEA